MKSLIILLIFGIVFSSYTNPPFIDVNVYNNGKINNLQSTYLQSVDKKNPTYEDPIAFASARLLLAFPSVDNRISADKQSNIIWVWAENHSVKEKRFDGSCTDERTYVDYTLSGSISFTFKNNTRNISITNKTELTVSIPFTKDELDKTNGSDELAVKLEGNFIFIYNEIDYGLWCSLYGCNCVPSLPKNVSITYHFSDQLSYLVEGGSVIFFLSAPVLHEQWAKNNHFDNIILSKRLFYSGVVKLNNNKIASFNLYNFDIDDAGLGLLKIVSFKNFSLSNIYAQENKTVITPIPLEKENETFVYVYKFDTNYSGIGVNNLSIELIDHFESHFNKEAAIASRLLSFNENISEDNTKYGFDKMRESAPFFIYSLDIRIISFATVGILLIAFLALNRIVR